MPELCSNITDKYSMQEICSEITVIQTMDCFFSGNFTTLDEICDENDEFRHQEGKHIPILRSVSAIVSIIASMILIWMIRRSHKGLKSIYHRLLLGLSISDILFSLSQAFFNITAPYESSYVVWNARGSAMSCGVQGFTRFLGGMCGQGYNCSINLFSLAMIKKKTKTMEPVKKLEPYLHGVPIGLAIVISTISVSTQGLNVSIYGNCWEPVYDLPHCKSTEGLPDYEGFGFRENCNRGLDWQKMNWVFINFFTCAPPIIVLLSLAIIYRIVVAQEKKIQRYSFSSSRAESEHSSFLLRARRRFSSLVSLSNRSMTRGDSDNVDTVSSLTENRNVRLSRGGRKRSCDVMARAMAYSIGYLLTWSGGIVIEVYKIQGKEPPTIFVYLAAIFMPLQGLYNWLIFMYPRVIAEKHRITNDHDADVNWREAFLAAFWSNGKKDDRPNQGKEKSETKLRSKNQKGKSSNYAEHQTGALSPTQNSSNQASSLEASKAQRSSGQSTSIPNVPSKSTGISEHRASSTTCSNIATSKSAGSERLSKSSLIKKQSLTSSIMSDRTRSLRMCKSATLSVRFADEEMQSSDAPSVDEHDPPKHENEEETYHPRIVDEELDEDHFQNSARVSLNSTCKGSEDFLPDIGEDEVHTNDNDFEHQKISLLTNEVAKANLDMDGSSLCHGEEEKSLHPPINTDEEQRPMEEDGGRFTGGESIDDVDIPHD